MTGKEIIKKDNSKDMPIISSGNESITSIIIVYILLALVGVIYVIGLSRRMMLEHDAELAATINSLVVEKVNISIEYLTRSVYDVSNVLSYRELDDLDGVYDELVAGSREENYVGIGIITNDKIYATDLEIQELEKWDLVNYADSTNEVAMSEPYRSQSTGKLVITMFSPIFQNDKKIGSLFITYSLEELQNITGSEVLEEGVEIYLMNALSENTILCSGSDEFSVGNWSNTKLYKKDIISDSSGISYGTWEDEMKNGTVSGSVSFSLDGISYTQVFHRIDAMEGWSVVVRMQNNYMSDIIRELRILSIAFVIVLLIVSIILLVNIRKRDKKEKDILANLSIQDPLTQIMNRRAFEYMSQEYLKDEGGKQDGVMIFIDVDYFKSVNDKFGHETGDKVLVGFANALKNVFDENAYVSRFGGDEFVVMVTRYASKSSIDKKMLQLKEEITKLQENDEVMKDSDFKLHYSAGIAAFPKDGQDIEELTKHSDEALYIVKEHGRDGFRWYGDDEEKK